MNKQLIFFIILFISINSALFALGSREQVSKKKEFISIECEHEFGAYCNEKMVFNIKHNLDISSIIKIELEFIWRKNFSQALDQFWEENSTLSLEELANLEEIFIQNFDHSMEELVLIDKKVYYFFPGEDITFEYWVGVGGWNDDIDAKLQEEMFVNVSEEYYILLIWLNNKLIYENSDFFVICVSISE
ncbi:MAG: hypothetical protein LBU88_03730 [Treponema sp.]|jgi:hypothetical protein|nr:hypothetical protein [Treponema sp.]